VWKLRRGQIVDVDLILSSFVFFLFLTVMLQIFNSTLPTISNFLLSESREKEILIFSSKYLKTELTIQQINELLTVAFPNTRLEVEFKLLGFEMPYQDEDLELFGKYLYLHRKGYEIVVELSTNDQEFWTNFSLEIPSHIEFAVSLENFEDGVDQIREGIKIYGANLLEVNLLARRNLKKIIRIICLTNTSFLVKIAQFSSNFEDLNFIVGKLRYYYHLGYRGGIYERYYLLRHYSMLHEDNLSFPIELNVRLWYI